MRYSTHNAHPRNKMLKLIKPVEVILLRRCALWVSDHTLHNFICPSPELFSDKEGSGKGHYILMIHSLHVIGAFQQLCILQQEHLMYNLKWLDKFHQPTSLKLLDKHLSLQTFTWGLQLEVHLQATFHPKKYVCRTWSMNDSDSDHVFDKLFIEISHPSINYVCCHNSFVLQHTRQNVYYNIGHMDATPT